jgi:predicted enzyme related to lactoylglutathione lyase
MAYPVVHWEIGGKDGKQLQEFYGQLFNWHVDANNPMDYGLVDTHAEGGINGGIFGSDDQPRVTIYVQVPDLQAALDRAEALGAKTVMPPTEIPDVVTLAMFADPAGNVTGLIKG